MPIIKFETGEEVEFKNMPTMRDIEDAANNLGISQKIAEQKRIQEEGKKGQEFLDKPILKQIFSKETAKELLPETGKIAKNIAIDTPIKVAKSLASVPLTLATGGEKTISGTYQSEAKERASDIIEGKKSLYTALTPFIEVPLDVTSTVGLGVGAKQLGKKAITEGIPAIEKQFAKTQANRAVKATQEVDDLIGKVIQGSPEDIDIARKALSQIDTKGIKTYEDLFKAFDDKIKTVASKFDEALESSPVRDNLLKLGDLENAIKVGEKTVRHNFVDDALKQLKNFYNKTGNIAKETAIDDMILKGNNEGLSVKEINDIAKLHGQDLNAFNASGELASGLSKQAAENTRQGVKSTVRTIFGDDAARIADKEISNLIKTRDLTKDMVQKVNTLQQKIQERGFGEQVGRLVFKVADLFTGGGLKGFVGAALPRGAGYKVLNALDLEKMLSKNLKQLDKALKANNEKDIIKILEEIIKSQSSKP